MKAEPLGIAAAVAAAAAAAVVLISTAVAPAAGTASGCQTSANDSYTATLCLQAPDGPLAGDVPVTVTLDFSAPKILIREVEVKIDGAHLLSDYEQPFSFQLPSYLFADGSHALAATALLRDNFRTQATTLTVQFANGGKTTTPPSFAPTAGTTPARGRPFVVGVAGDGAGGEHEAADVAKVVSSWNPNLFLYLGDVYKDGTPTEFANWYAPAAYFGRFRPITDPTPGNHEYTKNVANGYFWYWQNAPHFYSLDTAGWHIISLDSTSQFNQFTPGSPQYAWLQHDLAAHPNPCTLVFYHHPAFSVGPEGETSGRILPVWQLLSSSGVDIVLNGHDHNYQRWQPLDVSGQPSPTGTTEFVVGASGHGVRAFVTQDGRLARGGSTIRAFGALRLTLNAHGAGYQYITTKGKLFDSGSVTCSGSAGDTAPPSQPQLQARAGYRQAIITWRESSDDVGVVGYELYRNNHLEHRLNTRTSFVDTGLEPSSRYRYSVVAVDAAGHRSAASTVISVLTPSKHKQPPKKQ